MELIIDHLNKTYPNGIKAIDDLSLTVGVGMFGLLGPNGAGKSSLMRTIATLQVPDSGNIAFNGIDVMSEPMSLRRQLGYLPQAFGVYPKVSAEKLLNYFALLKGILSKKERSVMVDHVLELTNLHEVRRKSVSGYSGGMKQRFGIAQLLLGSPRLIIVDEPTAGLDPAERNRFLNALREIGAENIVIFSTHIVDDVTELCTDMAIMDCGKILQHLDPISSRTNLRDKVWTISIDQQDLESYERQYQVLSSGFNQDNTLNIRVHAELQPAKGFARVEPNLEDVYFMALNTQSQLTID